MIPKKAGFLSAATVGAAIGISTYAVAIATLDQPMVEVHYAPKENLARIDIALIDSAQHSIDMAAYLITDYRIADALTRALDRGVQVLTLIDCRETKSIPAFVMKNGASWFPLIICRDELMHLKSYVIDGKVLRTGSANFSHSGLLKQNNDLVIIRDRPTIAAFERQFKEIMK